MLDFIDDATDIDFILAAGKRLAEVRPDLWTEESACFDVQKWMKELRQENLHGIGTGGFLVMRETGEDYEVFSLLRHEVDYDNDDGSLVSIWNINRPKVV